MGSNPRLEIVGGALMNSFESVASVFRDSGMNTDIGMGSGRDRETEGLPDTQPFEPSATLSDNWSDDDNSFYAHLVSDCAHLPTVALSKVCLNCVLPLH